MDNALSTRRLTPDDWREWREIRLEALKKNPEAFTSSYEEEAGKPDDFFKLRLEDSYVVGAFDKTMLVGVMGFSTFPQLKKKHRGFFWGVYVQDAYRKHGAGQSLITQALAYAQGKAALIECGVLIANAAAKKLYERNGFEQSAILKDSMRMNGVSYDEYLMVKTL
jgi:RimJ/RimL family protein N-acetyltransferase